jgi:hypothetical protein
MTPSNVVRLLQIGKHAVIPPRKNAKPWKDKKAHSLERNELLRA